MNPCLSTAIPAGQQDTHTHTHSHFSPSLSVLMRFIGVTNNVTFALPMQPQLNSRWWGTVQWRQTSLTVSGSIFLCVWSFCSQHLKYMQMILYMQIYAKWHQICKKSGISFHCSFNFSLSFVLFYSNACKSPWAVQGNLVLHLNRAAHKHTLLQFN